jgi:hypothetical protein
MRLFFSIIRLLGFDFSVPAKTIINLGVSLTIVWLLGVAVMVQVKRSLGEREYGIAVPYVMRHVSH